MSKHMTECMATKVCPVGQPTEAEVAPEQGIWHSPMPVPASGQVSMQYNKPEGNRSKAVVV